MSADVPEVATASKAQITVPGRLREGFGPEQGTKLVVAPTAHGLGLQKIDLPAVEEFRRRVEERADEVDQLVHEARTDHERARPTVIATGTPHEVVVRGYRGDCRSSSRPRRSPSSGIRWESTPTGSEWTGRRPGEKSRRSAISPSS
jgi:bifunctional DNA-binding transcriptional regulator/antitoxin component of YhaV-PrlF toxin-antitoxin module